MNNKLTSQSFWKKYWSNKNNIKKVGKHLYFGNLIKGNSTQNHSSSFIEIGGFPGYYAIYAYKYLNMEATLFDYYIDKNIMNKILKINSVSKKDIVVTKEDLFKYKSKKKYDIVFSSGFIEHFSDPELVVKKHVDLLKTNGTLIITLPNFLGLNGLIQKHFDPEMLAVHNLETMKISNLKKYTSGKGLKKTKIYYYGNSGAWLERLSTYPLYIQAFIYVITAFRLPLSILNINNKFISPHIVITATKK